MAIRSAGVPPSRLADGGGDARLRAAAAAALRIVPASVAPGAPGWVPRRERLAAARARSVAGLIPGLRNFLACAFAFAVAVPCELPPCARAAGALRQTIRMAARIRIGKFLCD